MPKKIEVVIDRTRWRTGQDSVCSTGKGDTLLRNKSGYQCCLGFLAKTVIPKETITGHSEPHQLNVIIPEITDYRKGTGNLIENTQLCCDAMTINDCLTTTPKQKEKELKKLFAKSRYKLTFVGEYRSK